MYSKPKTCWFWPQFYPLWKCSPKYHLKKIFWLNELTRAQNVSKTQRQCSFSFLLACVLARDRRTLPVDFAKEANSVCHDTGTPWLKRPLHSSASERVRHFIKCCLPLSLIFHFHQKEHMASIMSKNTIYSVAAFEMAVRTNSNRRTLATNCTQNGHLARWAG